ncbi:hypothetical protein PC110_g631 [Phytophthora cactorum]|uniref:Pyruvate kinase C-terminal domain-containing protein n=1 Tax=Phytophthora cactorum TaxID=29920 RepID=A0A329T3Y1_9STRA|nr:hypothetical protein PC110_g631 [Phytophthora cactorum]
MSAALSLNLKSVDCIKANVEGVQRKTKIFCTLGPACWSEEGLLELIDAGMNVARFNFSHGDHASHLSCLTRLRGALAKRPNKNVAIMLDTKGPEIRTGFLANKGKVNGPMETAEAVASSAVKTAIDINAKMLVVLTETGNTARLVAKYRPEMPVLVLTALEQTARQTEGFVKGVVSRCVGSMIGTDSILYRATETGKDLGWLKKGDAVVAVHGIQEAKSGSTNLLKVLYVE